MAKRRENAKSLTGLLNQMAETYGWKPKLQQIELEARWAELVGERIAAVATPEGIRFGELRVRVATPTWRTELHFQEKLILQRLQENLPSLGIKSIRWV